MGFISWIFGFLFFHRKLIIGAILLAGLIYWLLNGKDIVPQFIKRGERNKVPLVDSSPGTLESVPEVPPQNDLDTVEQPAELIGVEQFLANATASELIKESLRLNEIWKNTTHPLAFMIVSKRKRIALRLLEHELSDVEKEFATISYLETLSVLDSLNVQGKLGINATRDELLEHAQRYLDDPSPAVSSLANLAVVVIPGYEFITDPSEQKLGEFEQAFDKHFDATTATATSARKLGEIVLVIQKLPILTDETKKLALHALDRFKTDTSEAGVLTFGMLQEQVYFGTLDLPTIVDRMSRSNDGVDGDVDDLFSSLNHLPDSRIEIYQVALDVIREFIQLGKTDVARKWIAVLEQDIAPKISNDELKQKMLKGVAEFEPFLEPPK